MRRVTVDGYFVVAQCVTDVGRVLLVHNESSHYLVLSQLHLGPDGYFPDGVVVAEFEYAGRNALFVFGEALAEFRRAALAESASLDEE